MDHLSHFDPHIQHSRRFPLIYNNYIPYKTDRDWFTFPDDYFSGSTWKIRDIAADVNAHADLLQSWLLFGSLYEVSKALGVELCMDDFIAQEDVRVVTTGKLNHYLWLWAAAVTHSPELRERRLDYWDHVTTKTRGIITLLSENYSVVHPVLIPLTIVAEFLEHAFNALLGYQTVWERCRVRPLLDRVTAAGWCPGEVARLASDGVPAATFYLLSCRQKRHDGKDHSRCTDTQCNADQLDESRYQTAHATIGCTCAHYGQQIAGDIQAVVAGGGIPVLSVDDSEDGISVKVVDVNGHSGSERAAYVAISHVWSDGMGNVQQNTLPKCLLMGLQSKIDQMGDASVKHFWIDTLCVPLDRGLRTKAIRSMARVYSQAQHVLVIDKSIQWMTLSNSSKRERLIYLSLCPWTRRLWTLQEAWLPGLLRLWCDFDDRPMRWADIVSWDLQTNPTSVTAVNLDLEESNQDHAKLIQHIRDVLHRGSREFENGTAQEASSPGDGDVLLAEWIKVPDALDRVFMHALAFTQSLLPFRTATVAEPSAKRMKEVVGRLQGRMTSRVEDEPVCIASLLGIDPLTILQAHGPERMKELLRGLNEIPVTFLFGDEPRLAVEGFRWAPQSYLALGLSHTNHEDERVGTLEARGLCVTLPGVSLHLRSAPEDVEEARLFLSYEGDEFSLWRSAESPLGLAECVALSKDLKLVMDGELDLVEELRPMRAALVAVEGEEDVCSVVRFLESVMVMRGDPLALEDGLTKGLVICQSLPPSHTWYIR
ncbi:Sugar transporter stl1 [Mycena sanguinolenta]|uniref:Sugar transporter stl1 n=1 Tax=Mycena sanguinolenta TaxID=230812 RepID=A0A8H6ZLE0_9AGAR|nr:Sugar transporter stl1 [Mycena sanguinolenta]